MEECLIGFDSPGTEMPQAELRYSMWGLQKEKNESSLVSIRTVVTCSAVYLLVSS